MRLYWIFHSRIWKRFYTLMAGLASRVLGGVPLPGQLRHAQLRHPTGRGRLLPPFRHMQVLLHCALVFLEPTRDSTDAPSQRVMLQMLGVEAACVVLYVFDLWMVNRIHGPPRFPPSPPTPPPAPRGPSSPPGPLSAH